MRWGFCALGGKPALLRLSVLEEKVCPKGEFNNG